MNYSLGTKLNGFIESIDIIRFAQDAWEILVFGKNVQTI